MILFICLLSVFTLLLLRTTVLRGQLVVKGHQKVLGVTKRHDELRVRAEGKISIQGGPPASLDKPAYSLISRCPECSAQQAHLLMNLTATVADRRCVECDHEWKEQVVV